MIEGKLKILFSVFFFLVFISFLLSCHSNCKNSDKKSYLLEVNKHREYEELSRTVELLNRQGTDARDNAQYKEALNFHFKAFRTAKEINDTVGQIFALNNIGTDLRRTSSNSEASSYYYAALGLSGDKLELLKSKAVAMNGLGNIFLALNNAEKAKAYFMQSMAIEQKLKSNLGQAINYANIAETFRMNEQYDSALHYCNQSLKHNQIIHSELGIALCEKLKGCIYLSQKKTPQALQLMRQAVKRIDNSKDIFHKLDMKMTLCLTLVDLNYFEEASALLDEILLLSLQIHSYDNLYNAYILLAKLKSKEQKFKEAFQAKEKVSLYRDSLLQQNSEVRIAELENRYRNKQNAQKIELLTAEKIFVEKTKTNQRNIFFLLSLLLVSIIVLLFSLYYNRRKVSLELEKINEIKSRFFTNISHEFRTPLTLIKAPVENLIENNENEEINEELNIVLRNANRMLFLVEQLLNISKVDAGKFKIKAQQSDLAAIINVIAHAFEHDASRKSIFYQIGIEQSGNVWFDANIVEIILINLLSNAIKFAPENGTVKLTTSLQNDFYSICVINDTNREFSNEELKHIFDRFYTTADKSRSGTGIGLSLIKEICTLYRTEIDLQYNNRNIEFSINLPVNKSHFKEDEISDEKLVPLFFPDKKEISLSIPSGKKEAPIVLIVEDNNDMRYFLHQIFRNDYQIIEARNGKEGIEKAKEAIPDIVISDIMMPDINGLTLCETLKSDYLTNHIPVILLTALNEPDDIIKGLECKADDYVTKPFNSKILLAKIKNQLEHRDILIKKYREEMNEKPFDFELKDETKGFGVLLNNISKDIINPDFGVDEFCSICAMSRTQLHRKLKALTGLSATAYIRFCRVNIASKLLQNKEMTIADVCYASGFNDTSYFSKCFREEFNLSPLDYRKGILR